MSDTDPHQGLAATPSGLGRRGAMVTPSDTTDLPLVAKAVVVCVAGNLVIIPPENADGAPITFTDCPVGFIPPFQVRRVKATGTTATVASVDR
ncbi:spike base protein, RCAP_Rcc01079 family [Xanthobacter flavus]|uniref:spike base protein, RCAP_Rcc01079 family n=1 Tax=Xanthobacter flavus TaxID=281 RepID=UPI00372A1536